MDKKLSSLCQKKRYFPPYCHKLRLGSCKVGLVLMFISHCLLSYLKSVLRNNITYYASTNVLSYSLLRTYFTLHKNTQTHSIHCTNTRLMFILFIKYYIIKLNILLSILISLNYYIINCLCTYLANSLNLLITCKIYLDCNACCYGIIRIKYDFSFYSSLREPILFIFGCNHKITFSQIFVKFNNIENNFIDEILFYIFAPSHSYNLVQFIQGLLSAINLFLFYNG